MTPEERRRIAESYQAEEYGTMSAPRHPWLLDIANGIRSVHGRLEGNPAQYMIPGEGTAGYLGKLAYDQSPDMWDRVGVLGDALDMVPGGALVGAMGIPAKAMNKARLALPNPATKKVQNAVTRENAWQALERLPDFIAA